ncbi:MAG: PqqD family protein [Sphingomicrobium sp.]
MTALIKCSDRLTETSIDEEIVVMRLDSGEFFALSKTGAAIWGLIDGNRDRAAILAALGGSYDTAHEQLSNDIEEFVEKLTKAGLIEEI